MKLLWSPKSPFVRKVMIVAHELQLVDRLELVRAVAVPRGEPNPIILQENPLGKIPALLVPELPPLFDSSVICEYLCSLVPDGSRLLPKEGKQRMLQLRWQALGDGLTENLLLWRGSSMGKLPADPELITSFRSKVRAAMRVLESETGQLASQPFGIGHIAVICALGQLDFRFQQSAWRVAHPALAKWLESEEARTSVRSTAIINDQTGDAGPYLDLTF